ITCLDLFCGAGGSSEGARQAGCEIVGAVDAWDMAIATYRDNHPRAEAIQACIGDGFDFDRLQGFRGVDLILASPECTMHSQARRGAPDVASLEQPFLVLPFIDRLKPRWVVVENVVRLRQWTRYREFLGALSGRGYHIKEEVLDSADFGVPQARRRLFVLADRERLPPVVQPPGGKVQTASSILADEGVYPLLPLRIPGRATNTVERVNNAIWIQETFNRAIGIDQATHWHPFLLTYYGNDAHGYQSIDRPLRTVTTVNKFLLVVSGQDGPWVRMLQPVEYQAAMGFPSTYRFERGTIRQRIRMLGNGVCPPVMQAIVKALVSPRPKGTLPY
ncbi:MAG: DNA cytosine methyltransferase, partial [Magnetococcales bacterium]|nr:DNA cytosine methyltransferase [Magnetococcales bacterium]